MDCSHVLNKIDELNENYLAMLEDVCNIESPTSCKSGVDAVGRYFINAASARGWKVEVSKQTAVGDVVCITMNPEASEAPISLSGHIDTVHPLGAFGAPAVKREGERIYGPGVTDCKGGVVAAFYAMVALEECGFKRRPVQLLLQSDEENSSLLSNFTTINYICEKASGSVAFLNLEPYTPHRAVVERKGIIRYDFTVHGKAGHSAYCYDLSNAVTEAAYKMIELEKFKDKDGITCNCGVISGGTVANSVCGTCTFSADIRFFTLEELALVRKTVADIGASSKVEGCTCTVAERSFRPSMPYSEKNYNLLETVNGIYKENGLPILEAGKSLGGSDAAYVTDAGIPCLDSLGTCGRAIHSTNEEMFTASLAESAKRIAAVAWCI